ncbi:hypothetical protein PSHT_15776, partial [Puccinia striiformis]
MLPAGSHITSGLTEGLPSQGLNITGLNSPSLSSTMDSNHHNTSTNNPAPANHLPTTGNQTAPDCPVSNPKVQKRIRPHLFFQYLSHSYRINGPLSWNNFQKYDPEAFDCDEAKDKDTKLYNEKKWYHMNTLSHMERDIVLDSGWMLNQTDQSLRKTGQNGSRLGSQNCLPITLTAHCCIGCVDGIICVYHQVEGTCAGLFASKGPPFQRRRFLLPQLLFGMVVKEKGSDAPAEFHIWVAAQSIQINNGCQPTEIKQQCIKSVSDITNKFLLGKIYLFHFPNVTVLFPLTIWLSEFAGEVSDNFHKICVKLREK